MSIFASPRFLPRVLWADAASCVASGALQLAALDALPELMGLPRALLLYSGVFLVTYGAVLAWIASRADVPRRLVGLCALGNVGWAVGCAAAIAVLRPSAWGVAWIAAQAACVLVLAALQWTGLRGLQRPSGLAAA